MKKLMREQMTFLVDEEVAKTLKNDLEESQSDYTMYDHPDKYVRDYLAQLYLEGQIPPKNGGDIPEDSKQAILDNYKEFRDSYIVPRWESKNQLDQSYTDDAFEFVDSIPDPMTRTLLGGFWDPDEDEDDQDE